MRSSISFEGYAISIREQLPQIAELEARETYSEALTEYVSGQRDIRLGKVACGIDHLRRAAALDRSNAGYTIALADAVRGVGKPGEAEVLLVPLLDRQANNGAANLAFARVSVAQGKVEDAKAFYHRAIFGLWPVADSAKSERARFELIDLMMKSGRKSELLAELLPIQVDSEAPDSLRLRIGKLFLAAGSPVRAAGVFRELINENPRDAAAYSGIGEASLALGNFRTAQRDPLEARRLLSSDTAFAERIAVADSALAIDPTQRGIGAKEENRRALNLMKMVAAHVQGCSGSVVPTTVRPLVDSTTVLSASPTSRNMDASTGAYLALAERLWSTMPPACIADEVLTLVVDRVAR